MVYSRGGDGFGLGLHHPVRVLHVFVVVVLFVLAVLFVLTVPAVDVHGRLRARVRGVWHAVPVHRVVIVVLPVFALGLPDHLLLRTLESLLPPEVASVLEHVTGVRMQRPVAAFTRSVRSSRHFDETVVERETVSDRVLPALLVLSVKREQIHDELVDLTEGAHFVGRLLDGHGDEGDVGVGRFGVRVAASVRLLPGAVDRLRPHIQPHGRHGAVHGVHGAHGTHGSDAVYAAHATHGVHAVHPHPGGRRHGHPHAAHARGCTHPGRTHTAHVRRHVGHRLRGVAHVTQRVHGRVGQRIHRVHSHAVHTHAGHSGVAGRIHGVVGLSGQHGRGSVGAFSPCVVALKTRSSSPVPIYIALLYKSSKSLAASIHTHNNNVNIEKIVAPKIYEHSMQSSVEIQPSKFDPWVNTQALPRQAPPTRHC